MQRSRKGEEGIIERRKKVNFLIICTAATRPIVKEPPPHWDASRLENQIAGRAKRAFSDFSDFHSWDPGPRRLLLPLVLLIHFQKIFFSGSKRTGRCRRERVKEWD